MPSGPTASNRVAIVGASSLRGKELKQVLEDRNFTTDEIVLLDQSAAAGTLTEAGGEPTFIRAVDKDSFEHVRFAFFVGSAFEAEHSWHLAQSAGATVIDLSGAVNGAGRSKPWIPSLSSLLPPPAFSGANGSANPRPYYSPSAPVIIGATIAAGLGSFKPLQVALTLFPPVSERDRLGVEELESQTTNLLSFRPIEKTVFGEQVAFNLLFGYGYETKPKLADLRKEVATEVARYLAGRALAPAIQLIQAPLFYGYAFSAYAEFPAAIASEQVASAFTGLGVKVAAEGDPVPNNVTVAGDNEIQIGRIETDPSVAAGIWLWGVADNLRLPAVNAVRIAEELVGQSTAG